MTRSRGALLATMCVGMFLVQLDVTVVNVALPDIRSGLGTSLAGQQWVVDAYAVVLAVNLRGSSGDCWEGEVMWHCLVRLLSLVD